MKFAIVGLALAVALAPLGLARPAIAQAGPPASTEADGLFRAGKFDEAGVIYQRLAAADPEDYAAALQLGRIALMADRLDEARRRLEAAARLRPAASEPKVMLAETFYRRDDFAGAAAALEGVDVAKDALLISQYPTLNVAKLTSFKGQTPYEVSGPGEEARLAFVKTDPLPVVTVRVDGGAPVTFFIDTGGSEVTLDTAFGAELGAPRFGTVQGTFSGGQHADVEHGRIESLTLDGWTVRNLPVAMMPLRQLSSGFGVKRIDGIIGTTLLYHFLATLDYPRGELVLRRKTAPPTAQGATVPIRMAGDHFMVGWGRVDGGSPTRLFVDTGLAGAGVKLAQSVIRQAGITLDEAKATEGAGGGGTLRIVPYTVRRLSFGDVQADNIAGLYDGPFPWEDTFGFHLAGMVGHEFFKPYAVTFDFQAMEIVLRR